MGLRTLARHLGSRLGRLAGAAPGRFFGGKPAFLKSASLRVAPRLQDPSMVRVMSGAASLQSSFTGRPFREL